MPKRENNPDGAITKYDDQRGKDMKEQDLLNLLEEAFQKLSIRLDYEDLRKGEVNTDGGMFMLKGEKRVLVHKGLSVEDKVEVLTRVLARMDTESLHLPPAVRKRLEGTGTDKGR